MHPTQRDRSERIVQITMENLATLSRTVATSSVNTDTATGKLEGLAHRASNPNAIAQTVRDALRFLDTIDLRWLSPEILLELNRILVSPFYPAASWRSHESDAFGYLPASRIAA